MALPCIDLSPLKYCINELKIEVQPQDHSDVRSSPTIDPQMVETVEELPEPPVFLVADEPESLVVKPKLYKKRRENAQALLLSDCGFY